MQPVYFHPQARKALKDFPVKVKKAAGKAILELQKGHALVFPLSRPMPSVGLGVEEIRLKDANGAYRIFYFKKAKQAILVFHAFIKKTQKTPKHEIQIAQKRLREIWS